MFSGVDGSAGVRWEDRKTKGRLRSWTAPHKSFLMAWLWGAGYLAKHSTCSSLFNPSHKDPWERDGSLLN